MDSDFFFGIVRLAEWSGRRWNGAGAAMHLQSTDGVYNAACPVCGGVKPEDGNGFYPEARGHRDSCELAALLRRINGGQPGATANPFERLNIAFTGTLQSAGNVLMKIRTGEKPPPGAADSWYVRRLSSDTPFVADKPYRVTAVGDGCIELEAMQ